MITKWRRRALVAAPLILLLGPGRTQTRNEAPQPLGILVDAGGYRVHLYCIGNGAPTVVITGAGYSFDWGLVQPEVAKFTRVCAYDHSGIAWSDPGPKDSCSVRAGEIHAALRNAKIAGPYVLVGHSLGALVSRLYANQHGDEVAGMVIVDHAFNGGLTSAPPLRGDLPIAVPRAPLAARADMELAFQKLSARDYRFHVWASSLPGSSKIMERNIAMMPECVSEVEAASRNRTSPLGGKPLIVLSQSRSFGAYAELQTRLVSLSSNSKQVLVENSSHYMMIDRPEVVVGAIHEVLEAAQKHTRLKNQDRYN